MCVCVHDTEVRGQLGVLFPQIPNTINFFFKGSLIVVELSKCVTMVD